MKQIENLTHTLRDLYYSADKKTFIINIELDDIKLNDLRKLGGQNIINKLTEKKWKLLDKNRKLFKIYDTINFNIQIREHSQKENKNDIYSKKNNSKLAKFIFSGIGAKTNLNSTELPIMNIELKKVPETLKKKLKIYEIELDSSKTYSVELTEHFFKMITLTEFLKEHNKLMDIKVVLFYIFLTLFNYKKLYPKFQHNALKTDNIYVYLIDPEDTTYNKFVVDGVTYILPNVGCEVKVTCFENCNFNQSTTIKIDTTSIIDDFKDFTFPGLKQFISRIEKYESYKEIIFDDFFNEFKQPIDIDEKILSGLSIAQLLENKTPKETEIPQNKSASIKSEDTKLFTKKASIDIPSKKESEITYTEQAEILDDDVIIEGDNEDEEESEEDTERNEEIAESNKFFDEIEKKNKTNTASENYLLIEGSLSGKDSENELSNKEFTENLEEMESYDNDTDIENQVEEDSEDDNESDSESTDDIQKTNKKWFSEVSDTSSISTDTEDSNWLNVTDTETESVKSNKNTHEPNLDTLYNRQSNDNIRKLLYNKIDMDNTIKNTLYKKPEKENNDNNMNEVSSIVTNYRKQIENSINPKMTSQTGGAKYTDSEQFFFLNNQNGGESLLEPVYETVNIENNDKRAVYEERKKEKFVNTTKKPEETKMTAPFIPIKEPEFPKMWMYPNYYNPVIHNYTINNPLLGDHLGLVNSLYQDVLTDEQVKHYYSTIKSRLSIHSLVRNFILNGRDGKEIHLANKNERSILSHVKILESNPKYYKKDIYPSVPYDTVIIRCGYPIRFNKVSTGIIAGVNSVSINLRIYRLDNAEYQYPVLPYLRNTDFNCWRELMYYQFVLNEIIDKGKSPHFIFLYGYFMNKNKIKFDDINKNRNDVAKLISYKYNKLNKYRTLLANSNPVPQYISYNGKKYSGVGVMFVDQNNNYLVVRNSDNLYTDIGGKIYHQLKQSVLHNVFRKTNNRYNINYRHLDDKYFIDIPDNVHGNYHYGVYVVKVNDFPQDLGTVYNSDFPTSDRLKRIIEKIEQIKSSDPDFVSNLRIKYNYHIQRDLPQKKVSEYIKPEEEIMASDSKVSLMIVTECAEENLYKWTSREYDTKVLPVKTMTKTGIHSVDTWKNVIFQILHGLLTMQKNKFCIRNLNIKDNIFIKSLPLFDTKTYYKYIINNVDYFVPHCSYLVMFDILGIELPNFNSKVLLPGLQEETEVQNEIWNGLEKIFNPNSFAIGNILHETNLPPKEIQDLMSSIYDEITVNHNNLIENILLKYFYHYFKHPRVGTALADQERHHLSNINKNFKVGELVVYSDIVRETSEVWAVIVRDIDGFNCEIYYGKNRPVTVNKNIHLQKYISSIPLNYSVFDRTQQQKVYMTRDNVFAVYKI
jgi:hypothetical protein